MIAAKDDTIRDVKIMSKSNPMYTFRKNNPCVINARADEDQLAKYKLDRYYLSTYLPRLLDIY